MKHILFIKGIILQIIGAILLIEGNIFGERTITAAIILSMIGIILIARFSPWKVKKQFNYQS